MADQPITSDLRHFAGNDADTRMCRHAADLIEALEAEIKRLRGWIDRQEPSRAPYGTEEVRRCPICHEPTEYVFMGQTKPHADGCPWREEARRG